MWPRTRSSAITGQGLADPNGVMVPCSYPVACLAASASGMDRRLTPSSRRSFGQEIARSPGTSTNRKSSSPRRTTSVLTTSAGVTPRARAASAKLRTGPCWITRWGRLRASAAFSAGVDTVEYPAPAGTRPGTRSVPRPPPGPAAGGPSAPGGCRQACIGGGNHPGQGHLSDGRERRGGLHGGVSCASVTWRPVCARESPVICQLCPPHIRRMRTQSRGRRLCSRALHAAMNQRWSLCAIAGLRALMTRV